MGTHSAPKRPKPLNRLATIAGGVAAVGGAVLSYLVTEGVVSSEQSGAITSVVTAVVALAAAFGVSLTGQAKVTPIDDPVDNEGNPLTPAEVVVAPSEPAPGDVTGTLSTVSVDEVMSLPGH